MMNSFSKILIVLVLLFTCMFVAGDVWYYGSGEATNLENKIGFDKHSQKIISSQSTDPTTSPGVVAATGSLMMHSASGAYIKTGAANTDWSLIVDQRFLDTVTIPHGWETEHSAGSMSYDVNTRTLTVTHSTGENIYVLGKKIVKTTTETKQNDVGIGAYFFYYNSLGNIAVSAAGGTFDWATEVPIALVYYNGTASSAPWVGPDYVLMDERHSVKIPFSAQRQMHYSEGAVLKNGGFVIAGTYTVAGAGTGTVAENSYGIGSGTLIDQDLEHTLDALTDNAGVGNQYPVWYRNGASNEWRFINSNVPYYGGTNINYNLNTAGTYSLAETSDGDYMNMYVTAWNTFIHSDIHRINFIMGQAKYSTLALAQAESILSLNFTGIPSAEILPLYQVTMRVRNAYNDAGKNTRIEAVTRISNLSVNAMITFNPSTASAVTTTTDNFNGKLTALDTTVQTALDTLDDHVHNIASGNFIIASGNIITSGSGTNYQKVDALNQIINGDFEQGISLVTCTTGTCYHDSTAISGGKSLRVALSSQTANITNVAYTNAQYASRTVEVTCDIKSTITTAQLCAIDGSGNELVCSSSYDGSGIWKKIYTSFVTTNGVFRWKLKTTAAATGDIYLDNCYGGDVRGTSFYASSGYIVAPAGSSLVSITSFTPTGTWSTNTTYTGLWDREGEYMNIQTKIALAGAPTSAALQIDIPSGYTIATAKILDTSANGAINGYCTINDNGTDIYNSVTLHYVDTNTVALFIADNANSSTATVTQASPITFANGDFIHCFYSVPITGWSLESSFLAALPFERVAYVSEVQPQNTAAGTFTSGAWRTRVLNTVEGDTSIVSLASNQFTLQPGTYDINASAPAYATDYHQLKIYNITTSSDVVVGDTSYSRALYVAETRASARALVTITVPTTYEIRHICATTSTTYGLGLNGNLAAERFTHVTIRKLVR